MNASKKAVDECIKEGCLKDFLQQHKVEVKGMLLTEWNEEKYLEDVKRESEKHGEEIGQKRGEEKMGKLISVLMENNEMEAARRTAEDEIYREQLYLKYNIT